MEAAFWLQKWAKKEIAFHLSEANPLLVKYLESLKLIKNSRVFLPLCGKTLDIAWLLSKGYRVVGAELSVDAIQQLFNELGLTPTISNIGKLTLYQAKNLDIFVGDILHLTSEILGKVDAIYDRAALVALPESMRINYATHLRKITNSAPQLLITFTYDQNAMNGPPFSISQTEVENHYSKHYQLTLIENADLHGGLKGKVDAKENVWHLGKK